MEGARTVGEPVGLTQPSCSSVTAIVENVNLLELQPVRRPVEASY